MSYSQSIINLTSVMFRCTVLLSVMFRCTVLLSTTSWIHPLLRYSVHCTFLLIYTFSYSSHQNILRGEGVEYRNVFHDHDNGQRWAFRFRLRLLITQKRVLNPSIFLCICHKCMYLCLWIIRAGNVCCLFYYCEIHRLGIWVGRGNKRCDYNFVCEADWKKSIHE
jgi:hypothetical protein